MPDLLIAATTSDETNLISCMVGRKLGATHTIARVRDEEYYQDVVLLQDELGLSLSINPERTSAKEILAHAAFSGRYKSRAVCKRARGTCRVQAARGQ